MTTAPDDRIDPAIALPAAGGSPALGGWKLLGWALLWMVATLIGAAAFSFFFGVFFGVTGVHARLAPTDRMALYATIGGCGASIILLSGALRRIAGSGEVRARLGDGPISRPLAVSLIGIGIAAYVSLLSFGVLSASPEFFRRAVSVSWPIRLAGVSMAIVLAPLAEELFFRGRLWTALRGQWGAPATAVATGGLWLAIHLPEGISHAILLFPLALGVSFAREFGGSVRAPILIHALNNAVGSAMPWIFVWLGWLSAP